MLWVGTFDEDFFSNGTRQGTNFCTGLFKAPISISGCWMSL